MKSSTLVLHDRNELTCSFKKFSRFDWFRSRDTIIHVSVNKCNYYILIGAASLYLAAKNFTECSSFQCETLIETRVSTRRIAVHFRIIEQYVSYSFRMDARKLQSIQTAVDYLSWLKLS